MGGQPTARYDPQVLGACPPPEAANLTGLE